MCIRDSPNVGVRVGPVGFQLNQFRSVRSETMFMTTFNFYRGSCDADEVHVHLAHLWLDGFIAVTLWYCVKTAERAELIFGT